MVSKSLRLILPQGAAVSRSLLRPPPSPTLCAALLRCTPSVPLLSQQLRSKRQSRQITTSPARPFQGLFSALSSFATTTSSTPPPPKTLSARRLLPYPPSKIYTLIADISSYQSFLPNCALSRVTATTPPPQKHPALADLTVSWGPFTQTYTSRVYCVPDSIVEAVSGKADSSIPAEVLTKQGYNLEEVKKRKKMDGIFESLVTRWTVKGVAPPAGRVGRGEWSDVSLSVTFRFTNSALGFAAGQLADDKVDEMVRAFEERARRLYGAPK